MRTTIDIEDDILQAARELAAKDKASLGATLSRLARRGLQAGPDSNSGTPTSSVRNGVRMLPRRGELVTLSHVQRLLDSEDP